MKLYNKLYLAVAVLFAACSGEPTKIVVMASGKIAQNGDNVTLTPGTTHNEVIFDASGEKITVTSPAGNKEYDVKESGLYLLNLKKDTLAGSFQKTGTDNSQMKITEEGLWDRVDSLSQLMKGQNVSAANRNYSVAPMAIVKVTNNTNAQIIGPHRRLPGSFDPSKEHEVYKFYTNKEIAEIIAKVKKNMTGRDSTTAN